jgi:hypothetical protein
MNVADPLHHLLVSAIRHQEADEIDEARDLYIKILEKNPRHEQALHLGGLLCLQHGEFGGARALLVVKIKRVSPSGSADFRHAFADARVSSV